MILLQTAQNYWLTFFNYYLDIFLLKLIENDFNFKKLFELKIDFKVILIFIIELFVWFIKLFFKTEILVLRHVLGTEMCETSHH